MGFLAEELAGFSCWVSVKLYSPTRAIDLTFFPRMKTFTTSDFWQVYRAKLIKEKKSASHEPTNHILWPNHNEKECKF
jgi:hypothetical protein